MAALDSFSNAAKMQKRISFQQKLAAAATTKFKVVASLHATATVTLVLITFVPNAWN